MTTSGPLTKRMTRDDFRPINQPQHVQKLLELDLTLPDLVELDRWMATKESSL